MAWIKSMCLFLSKRNRMFSMQLEDEAYLTHQWGLYILCVWIQRHCARNWGLIGNISNKIGGWIVCSGTCSLRLSNLPGVAIFEQLSPLQKLSLMLIFPSEMSAAAMTKWLNTVQFSHILFLVNCLHYFFLHHLLSPPWHLASPQVFLFHETSLCFFPLMFS